MMIITVFRSVSNLHRCFRKARQLLYEVGSSGTFPVSRRMKAIVNIVRKIQLAKMASLIISMSSRWWAPLHSTDIVKFFLEGLSFSVGGQRKAKVRTA